MKKNIFAFCTGLILGIVAIVDNGSDLKRGIIALIAVSLILFSLTSKIKRTVKSEI